MDYKVVLFDLDGTLTDSKEGVTKCVQYALSTYGIEASLEELIPFVGPPLDDSFMRYFDFTKEKADEAIKRFRSRYEKIGLFENAAYEGIEEALRHITQKGIKVAVATSKPEVFAKRILEEYKLAHYFTEIVGCELNGGRNSKAEVIIETLKRLQLTEEDKKDILMVGDRKYDVLGAKSCGIETLGVYYGYAEPGELEAAGAKYIVNTVQELEEFFCS